MRVNPLNYTDMDAGRANSDRDPGLNPATNADAGQPDGDPNPHTDLLLGRPCLDHWRGSRLEHHVDQEYG